MVEEFKYLGTNLTNHNAMQEEIKSRLQVGNAGYHSVQYLLSTSLLSKNLSIKIYIIIILNIVFYGCKTWSLTMREERRRGYMRIELRIFGPKSDGETKGAEKNT